MRKFKIEPSLVIFLCLAAISGTVCYFKFGAEHTFDSFGADMKLLAFVLPKLGAAMLVAAFVQVLLPPKFFADLMGADTGVRGMAIATAAGSVTPGGPMTSFPIVTLLRDSGTGPGSLVAYVTAWSTMGLQRVFLWELPMMGPEFAILRFMASMPLGIVAGLIVRMFPPENSEPAIRTAEAN